MFGGQMAICPLEPWVATVRSAEDAVLGQEGDDEGSQD